MSHVPFNPLDPTPAEQEIRQIENREMLSGSHPMPSFKGLFITLGVIAAALGVVAILLRLL